MRANRKLLLKLALTLLAAGVLPFVVDAALPEPVPAASKAACCNVADAPPPPVSAGDEDFFSIPSGVPNVMILFDNSGSMQDELPKTNGTIYPIEYPGTMPAQGTCSLPATSPLETLSAKRTSRPYDAGYKTYYDATQTLVAMNDTPPWTTACTAVARPTTDNVHDTCFFRPDSYYKFYGEAPVEMDHDSAMVFNAVPAISGATGLPTENRGPCAAILDAAGAITGTTAQLAAYYATCTGCLASKGYYLFDPPSAGRQAVVRGDLLNVYPDNPLVKKAVTARKIVKDLVKLDPLAPNANVDIVRFGLAATTGASNSPTTALRTSDGAILLVPLGPDCDASNAGTKTAYVQARQKIVDAINNPTAGWVDFSSFTPLGEALYNVGQYFTLAGTGSEYRSRFTTTWMKLSTTDASQNFAETSRGKVAAPWVVAGANQRSFCVRCQQSSIILITDGKPTSDGNLPRSSPPSAHDAFLNDFRNWVKSDGSFTSGCTNCSTEYLHKVSSFLNTADLRTESAMEGSQSVKTYTVSFGLGALGDPTTSTTNQDAIRLLNKAAEMGGTTQAYITNSDSELKEALDTVVAEVQKRITSFSSTNATSLQTSKSTSADAYLGRFKPLGATTWEGHLYAAQIFDEFGEGCSEAFPTSAQKLFACGKYGNRNPNIDGDEVLDAAGVSTGMARCQSAYLVDKDCDPVVEDDTGFKKGDFNDVTHALASNGDPAKMHWDAGTALSNPTDPDVVAAGSYRSAEWSDGVANKRWIWTVIDKNADGQLTSADGTVEFRPENAAALAPMMNLPALGQAAAASLPVDAATGAVPWCNTWLDRIGICGKSPLPSCGNTVAAVQARCAEQIILFFRGWDVDDQDGDKCAGPGNHYNTNPWDTCSTDANCMKNGVQVATCQTVGSIKQCRPANGYCPLGEQRDRSADSRVKVEDREMWKLGDIFHSSPVLVRPPFSKSFCGSGAFNQCVLTLFSALGSNKSAVTKLDVVGTSDAYDLWREQHLQRSQFVVVGANDGMLHAFHAGEHVPGTLSPLEGYRFDSGKGHEMWGFIPPDLLPRLRHGLEKHTTYVDGNPMVRDVWVDGTGGHPADGVKQVGEFHTIAIISERSGGQRFTALDITNPVKPVFLWTYPQPCSEDSKLFGQTWSDFLPRPPPIGPVKLALPNGSGKDPLGRGYEERWVAFLNGGYDPALVRGRLVVMVDAWTGRPVWRFGDAELKAMRGDAKASMFPVAAGVSMLDIGVADDPSDSRPDTDGYFDTATFGDLGGNLYTARFHEPGVLDINGMVTNWWAARSFEQNRQTDDTQKAAGRGQFFYMTTNILDGPARLLTLLGSGDRENLLLKTNTCGPHNVFGCCASGCSASGTAPYTGASSSSSYGTGSCQQSGAFACDAAGTMTYTPGPTTACAGSFACGAPAAGPSQTASLGFSCGALGPMVTSATRTFNATGLVTSEAPFGTSELVTSALGRPLPQYRMFSVWSYGAVPSRLFSDRNEARAFDGNRFTDVAFSGCADVPGGSCKLVETSAARVRTTAAGLEAVCQAGSVCEATSVDPGWMYSYGLFCPAESCTPPAPWNDERSANGANVMRRCADWSTMRPDAGAGGPVSANPCDPGKNSPIEFGYTVDAVRGVPRKGCGVEDTTPVLAYTAGRQKSTMAPPQAGSSRIVVNEKGQVSYSTLKMEAGSTPEKTDLGRRNSLSDVLYWLEVPRGLHACRHEDPKSCK